MVLNTFCFEGKACCGVHHFQSLFRAPNQATITEVIKVAQMFPRFVEEEENRILMDGSVRRRIKGGTSQFQKDKSPGLDGWTIEFFLDLFDLLGLDLLKVVEAKNTGRIPASFNSTFIALIPKSDNPLTLNDFRPISLCN
jgi:hypothetical protein